MRYTFNVYRLFVADFARALDFYTAKLGMATRGVDQEHGWAELDTGGARLALERCDPDDPEAAELLGSARGICLEVEDIEAAHRELMSRGVHFTGAPEKQRWGGILAHLQDPEGNLLTLVQT